MTCNACVATIESYVGSQDGVESVSVTLLTERAEVLYDSAMISSEEIVEAIEDVGFTASEEDKTTITLNIGGMTCAACVGTVESALQSTPGVSQVGVNLLTGKAKVTFGKNITAIRDLIENVEDVGFEASLCKDKKGLDLFRKLTEIEYYRRTFFVSLFFMIIFLILSGLEHLPKVRAAFMQPIGNGFTVS